ncbi:MAG: ribbon-helix-helix protein, CopG family [Desulfobaccales bacterium]
MPKEMLAALDRQAQKEGRGRSNMIRIMIQAYLASTEKPRDAIRATDPSALGEKNE